MAILFHHCCFFLYVLVSRVAFKYSCTAVPPRNCISWDPGHPRPHAFSIDVVVALAEVTREQWCLHRIALRKDAGRRVVHVVLPQSWEEQVVVHTVWCTSPIRGRVGSVLARGVGTASMWAAARPNRALGSFYVAMARAHARSCDTSGVHQHRVQGEPNQ